MRLVIDESLAKIEPDAVRALKRIGREVSGELTGRLGLVAAEPSLSIEDALVAGAELTGLLGSPDSEISRVEAHAVLVGLIERDLAYRAPRRSPASAESTATAFLALCPGSGARFFTNGDLGLAHGAGSTGEWSSLTTATFDTGVVAIDGGKLAVFWVEDED